MFQEILEHNKVSIPFKVYVKSVKIFSLPTTSEKKNYVNSSEISVAIKLPLNISTYCKFCPTWKVTDYNPGVNLGRFFFGESIYSLVATQEFFRVGVQISTSDYIIVFA